MADQGLYLDHFQFPNRDDFYTMLSSNNNPDLVEMVDELPGSTLFPSDKTEMSFEQRLWYNLFGVLSDLSQNGMPGAPMVGSHALATVRWGLTFRCHVLTIVCMVIYQIAMNAYDVMPTNGSDGYLNQLDDVYGEQNPRIYERAVAVFRALRAICPYINYHRNQIWNKHNFAAGMSTAKGKYFRNGLHSENWMLQYRRRFTSRAQVMGLYYHQFVAFDNLSSFFRDRTTGVTDRRANNLRIAQYELDEHNENRGQVWRNA